MSRCNYLKESKKIKKKMSITFGYFHFHPDMIIHIWPEFFKAFVAIFLNIMLFRAGRAEKGKQKQKILTNLSIINVAFIILPFAIPSSVICTSIPTPNEITILRVYSFFSSILRTIPFFITYGIMMYRYGKRNIDLLSKYYMVSARILLLCNSFFVISITFPVFGIFTFPQFVFFELYHVLTNIFLLVYFVGWVFLALHGKIAGNINFIYAGILGCSLVVLNMIFFINRGMYVPF